MSAQTPLSLDTLRSAVRDAAAIRAVSRLQPAGGPGDKLFPSSYAVGDREPTKYAVEQRRVDGQTVECVLLDSVASQANRMEEALRRAWDRGQLTDLPVIAVDFSASEGLEDLDRITALDAPHRIADALLRDASLDGTPFRFSPPGEALTRARPDNAGPLFRWCPTALVFGVWDSTGPRGGMGSKFPRALVSEVVGINSVRGVKTASRLDPAGIEIKAATLLEAKDASQMWTLDESEAVMEGKAAKKYGRTKSESGKPSAANHGNVAPSIEDRAGGVTMDYAVQTTVLSLTALRRLGFPTDGDNQPVSRERRAQVEQAAHTALAALGLAAIALSRDEGYYFRSRCHLVPQGPLSFELIDRDGAISGPFTLSRTQAIDLLHQAADAARAAGIGWEQGEISLKPAPKLVALIQRSRTVKATGQGDEQAEK